MLFSSLIFLIYFLPIFFVSFYLSRKNIKLQNLVLLVFSLIFYSFGEPIFVIIMLLSILFNYTVGIFIDKYRNLSSEILAFGILGNLSILFYFKYLGFVINQIINPIGLDIKIDNIGLPLGISFFTFQAISYIVDLYRKQFNVQKNPINLALYISLFPQLIAGPIVRYVDIEKQINSRNLSIERTTSGLRIFIIGLAKKVLIANYFALAVDDIFKMNMADTSPNLWIIAIVSYTIQIYFDFSGYSDMAIGIAKIAGFDLKENFNYPYVSKSITEFWRRWHISLSSFLRDYLYIPLGGNRKGLKRTYINLFIVFFLCGLWHGANWTFMVWGMYFAIFLILEKLFLLKYLNKIPGVLSWSYSIFIIMFGWLIFRADNLPQIKQIIDTILHGTNHGTYKIYLQDNFFIAMAVIAVFSSLPVFKKKILCSNNQHTILLLDVFLCTLLMLVIISLAKNTYNPFIYFRF